MVTLAAMALMSLAPASHADDDYPYRGLGHCPLVPLPPQPHHQKPSGPGHHPTGPGHTGTTRPHGPGKPGATPAGDPTGPGKPADPPPRECAKHIWYYNGSYGDPWGFALRNCTSFVAWALRDRNGLLDFSNNMDGGSYGDAGQWDDNAKALGYLVDDVPAIGSVAQTDDGRVGHVAWVQAVGDGTVTVEEYNFQVAGGYDVRTVPTSAFRYLHLADIAPAPTQGPTRAASSVLDAEGRTWWARTTASGDLLLGGPVRRPARLGAAGSWTPDATPALATDRLGRTWVAAVSRSGRLLTAHTSRPGRWTRPRSLGAGWSTTSSPALGVDGRDRLHLLSLTAGGTLVERQTTDLRWRRGTRVGAPGSWAPHTSPALVADQHGRLWLSAVGRHGTLVVRHQHGRAGHWGRFDPLGGGWSVSSTPALALAGDGRLWLAAVTDRGALSLRSTTGTGRWHRSDLGTGRWSPYSSPALASDPVGRLWLAAERAGGQVVVRATRPHTGHWQPETVLGPASQTASTAVVPLAIGGVRVGAISAGAPRWWTVGLPRTSMAGAAGARGGGFSASLLLRIP